MAEKPSGQCEYCGHFRYTNDLFNGECVKCVVWAQDLINALIAESAEQRMYAEGYGREVLTLRADVAKYKRSVSMVRTKIAEVAGEDRENISVAWLARAVGQEEGHE